MEYCLTNTTAQNTLPGYEPTAFNLSFDSEVNDPHNFIEKYENTADLLQWSLHFKTKYFGMILKGMARLWYKNLIRTCNNITWSELVCEFRKMFMNASYIREIKSQLRRKRQVPGQCLFSYYYEVLDLCYRVDSEMTDDLKMEYIEDGLLPHYAYRISIMQPKTLPDLLKCIDLIIDAEAKMTESTKERCNNVYEDRHDTGYQLSRENVKEIICNEIKNYVNNDYNEDYDGYYEDYEDTKNSKEYYDDYEDYGYTDRYSTKYNYRYTDTTNYSRPLDRYNFKKARMSQQRYKESEYDKEMSHGNRGKDFRNVYERQENVAEENGFVLMLNGFGTCANKQDKDTNMKQCEERKHKDFIDNSTLIDNEENKDSTVIHNNGDNVNNEKSNADLNVRKNMDLRNVKKPAVLRQVNDFITKASKSVKSLKNGQQKTAGSTMSGTSEKIVKINLAGQEYLMTIPSEDLATVEKRNRTITKESDLNKGLSSMDTRARHDEKKYKEKLPTSSYEENRKYLYKDKYYDDRGNHTYLNKFDGTNVYKGTEFENLKRENDLRETRSERDNNFYKPRQGDFFNRFGDPMIN